MDIKNAWGWLKDNWPLIISIVILWITIAVTAWISMIKNQGHLVYALDDAYIHMSIAKNLAFHGVWGVSQDMFSSASSSLLWPLLLSLIFYCFGTSDLVPLVINIITATAILVVVHYMLRKFSISGWREFLVLLCILFLTPLPANVFSGMEHLLQVLLTTSAVYLAALLLQDIRFKISQNTAILMVILSSLVTMVRYEGLFVIFIICVLFLLRHRFLYAVILGAMGLLPIITFGTISRRMGWYFLPNPLMLKGNWPQFTSFQELVGAFVLKIELILVSAPHLIFLTIIVFTAFHYRYKRDRILWNSTTIMAVIFLLSTVLHLSFAGVGWFYRYEAYLVALGLLLLGIAAEFYINSSFDKSSLPKNWFISSVVIICLISLVARGVLAAQSTPQATTNIYHQQYQMGLFLQKYYNGAEVAANDIGVISHKGSIRILDLIGLTSIEPLRAKRAGIYNSEFIYDVAKSKGVEIAIVFDSWFEHRGGIPKQWELVGRWRILNNVVCSDDTVSFYAVNPNGREKLRRSLRAFSGQLPREVIQSGEYTVGL